jgi:hypothetical protein
MRKIVLIAAAAAALLAAPALAQDYTDAKLAAFAAAQTEMEPLTQLPRDTEAQQQAVFAQMRAVLDSHELSATEYNEMVAAVNANPALAERIGELQTEQDAGETSGEG